MLLLAFTVPNTSLTCLPPSLSWLLPELLLIRESPIPMSVHFCAFLPVSATPGGLSKNAHFWAPLDLLHQNLKQCGLGNLNSHKLPRYSFLGLTFEDCCSKAELLFHSLCDSENPPYRIPTCSGSGTLLSAGGTLLTHTRSSFFGSSYFRSGGRQEIRSLFSYRSSGGDEQPVTTARGLANLE